MLERSVLILLLDPLISLEIFLISIKGLCMLSGIDVFAAGGVRECGLNQVLSGP